jgi:hypothetical protein
LQANDLEKASDATALLGERCLPVQKKERVCWTSPREPQTGERDALQFCATGTLCCRTVGLLQIVHGQPLN